MKSYQYGLHLLVLLFLTSASIVSCKKDPVEPSQPQATTTITSIDPATAPVGGTLAVNGTNFSTEPGSNTVSIGGIRATIVSATPTRLVITVPEGAIAGIISVSAGGQSAQSTVLFTPAAPGMKPAKTTVTVQGSIRENTTWTNDKIYLLRGLVYVTTDHILTIQPGTVIKGASADQDPEGKGQAGTLIVELRGKLNAVGTAAQPIVFTSAKPAGQRNYGDWGGLVMIGKAPKNVPGITPFAGGIRGFSETYFEPEDNSGTLQYARIEFAGMSLPGAPANKLNGLTLYGVGFGTTMDHIQVSYSSNDAFAWYGGAVNMKYLVSYRTLADDWNADWGYVGKVQFGVALRDPDFSSPEGSNGIYSQNYDPGEKTDGTLPTKQNGLPQTAPIFANLSNFAFGVTPPAVPVTSATGYHRAGIYLRRNTAISVYNSLFYGFPEGLHLEGTATGTGANLTSGTIDLRGNVLANVLTPVVGSDAITNEQVSAYYLTAARANGVIASTNLAALLLGGTPLGGTPLGGIPLNPATAVPMAGSPLLTGAVTGGKLADSFFTPVTFRGAVGTENWLSGWTNFTPQTTDYDR